MIYERSFCTSYATIATRKSRHYTGTTRPEAYFQGVASVLVLKGLGPKRHCWSIQEEVQKRHLQLEVVPTYNTIPYYIIFSSQAQKEKSISQSEVSLCPVIQDFGCIEISILVVVGCILQIKIIVRKYRLCWDALSQPTSQLKISKLASINKLKKEERL